MWHITSRIIGNATDDCTHWPKQIIFSKRAHQFRTCSFVCILSMRDWVKPGIGNEEGTHKKLKGIFASYVSEI